MKSILFARVCEQKLKGNLILNKRDCGMKTRRDLSPCPKSQMGDKGTEGI